MTTPVATSEHQVHGLSFTPEQLARRRETLGASEIGAVAGLSKHRTALDVWAEKRGLAPSFAGNEFTEWGLRLEGPIAAKYADIMECGFEQPGSVIHPDEDWMSCTPDRIALLPNGRKRGLEIKRFNEHRADEFGVPGTDQVPDDVAAQCHWSMPILGLDEWDVAVLLGQADFRIYHLRRSEEITGPLIDIGRTFWFEHVLPGVIPEIDGSTASHRSLQQRFATHTQRMLAPTAAQVALGRQLVSLRGERARIESQESAIEVELKAAIGDAAGIEGVCTWKAPRAGAPKWKAIAEALHAPADLIAQHTGEASRRFLVTAKG